VLYSPNSQRGRWRVGVARSCLPRLLLRHRQVSLRLARGEARVAAALNPASQLMRVEGLLTRRLEFHERCERVLGLIESPGRGGHRGPDRPLPSFLVLCVLVLFLPYVPMVVEIADEVIKKKR
jgi:hypothetical protein